MASEGNPEDASKLEAHLSSEYAAIRYWAASGFATIASRGHRLPLPEELKALSHDEDPDVAAAAAAALCYLGEEAFGLQRLMELAQEDQWEEAASSLAVFLKTRGKTPAVEPHLPEIIRLAAKNDEPRSFHFRSILVDRGVNTPFDLYDDEKWQR